MQANGELTRPPEHANVDGDTVAGFSDEWTRFDQCELSDAELQSIWARYFSIFPWETLPAEAVGFDLGCGSGRWAKLVAPRVGELVCIDASVDALAVARRALGLLPNVKFVCASVGAMPFDECSMDFGYSLGVLHHVPDTKAGLKACVRILKKGAPLLVYLYYDFDNRPAWFRRLWQASDVGRRVVSRLPLPLRYAVSQVLAATVYYPCATIALLAERAGASVEHFPLSSYRDKSFYTMRTDALDRFGTRLERRFSLREIEAMMRDAGLERLAHRESAPYWCVLGFKR